MRVLSWNLFHGRSVPATRHELLDRFSALLAEWSWDAALLQEVPPWWPPALAGAAGARQRTVLTSRNLGLPLRRVLARWDPELMKSNGGGSNAILARGELSEHRALRLRWWPERRVAQIARLGDGVTVVNFHASARVPLAESELERLRAAAFAAAGPGPVVLGGDLNLRDPRVDGMAHAARRDVDHIFASGLRVLGTQVLSAETSVAGTRVTLSDHPPLLAELAGG